MESASVSVTDHAHWPQSTEKESNGLSEQVSVLEDQLKMASLASQRKLGEVQDRHRELGSHLEQALSLHRDIQSLCDT